MLQSLPRLSPGMPWPAAAYATNAGTNPNSVSDTTQIDKLAALCTANKTDVVYLVETWLSDDESDDVLDSEVAIHNYSVLGLDRTDMPRRWCNHLCFV